MNPIRILTAVGAAGALATASSGCGNSTSASEPPTTAASTPAAAAQRPAGTTVTGTIDEWSVAVSPAKVPVGKVTFKVTNAGKLPHEFVVLRTPRPAGRLGGGARISEAGHVGEIGGLAPGATKTVTLSLEPGHYSVICNLPSHYRMGMHADLTVG